MSTFQLLDSDSIAANGCLLSLSPFYYSHFEMARELASPLVLFNEPTGFRCGYSATMVDMDLRICTPSCSLMADAMRSWNCGCTDGPNYLQLVPLCCGTLAQHAYDWSSQACQLAVIV